MVAYLYDLDALGNARLITHAPVTWLGTAAGEPHCRRGLPATAYDVPAGHSLTLVVDTVDPLYYDENSGESITIAGGSYIDVPVQSRLGRRRIGPRVDEAVGGMFAGGRLEGPPGPAFGGAVVVRDRGPGGEAPGDLGSSDRRRVGKPDSRPVPDLVGTRSGRAALGSRRASPSRPSVRPGMPARSTVESGGQVGVGRVEPGCGPGKARNQVGEDG